MPGFKRLPNRYGTITKLSGKRRKPFCARKYIGEVWDDDKKDYRVKYVSVGTFETRREALDALYDANRNESFGRDRITFGELADKWYEEKEPTISDGLATSYRIAIRWLSPLHSQAIGDLRTDELETAINDPAIPRTMKHFCKIAMNGVYDYALRHEYVMKNYAELVKLHADQSAQIERIVYTPAEVDELLHKDRTTDEDVVLVMIYTGLRVSEALGITVGNVDLDKHLLVGVGMKTDAGRNRTVPIHDDIYPVIAKYAAMNAENPDSALFVSANGSMSPSAYKTRFRSEFPNHTTHDCRHSFATYAYKSRMDATIVKLIMGHRVSDITRGLYTHLDADDLSEEMRKFRIS